MYLYFDTNNKKIITTSQEFIRDGFVLFNKDQEEYFKNHKFASYDEIWYAGHLPPPPQPERTLEEAKAEKIAEIELQDISPDVNGFFYNGELMWLDKVTRVGLVNSCNSLESAGVEQICIWFDGKNFTLPINKCKLLLAALEIYAIQCFNVTEQHKTIINNFETIEEVDAFDVTADYPDRLNFND